MKKITLKLIAVFFLLQCYNLKAQTKSIAFLGQAPTYNDNISAAADGFTYDDDRAAAVWFMDVFIPSQAVISGTYFSFQDVAEGADISSYDAIWIQSDGATYPERLNEWPRGVTEGDGVTRHCVIKETGFEWNGGDAACIALEDAFISSIRSFYEAGGNIFLGNYAGKALEVIGAFDGLTNPWEYRPNQTFGDVTVNAANTAGAWSTNWSGNSSSSYISGITTTTATCSFSTQSIEFLSADTEKKNRACQYNLDFGRIYDDIGGTIADRRTEFENILNAEILLDNCDGNEIQGAQFNPRTSGLGTIVWYGSGVYDWYAPGTGNNDNVKLLTKNTLLSLADDGTTLTSNNLNNSDKVSVYPNPIVNNLNINYSGQAMTSVYDLSGKKILTTNSKDIDFSDFSNGIYIIKVVDTKTNQTYFSKVIK